MCPFFRGSIHVIRYRLMELRILLLSLTVASAVNLNCMPQTFVCDEEEVICNCTAPCSEAIHWWDNLTISFCSRTQLCNGNRRNCVPDTSPPVRVEVINCSSTDTFTSRLSYNASLSTSRSIQIGCSSSRINGTTCSPEDPLDSESVTLPVRNCTGLNLTSNPTVQPPTVLTSTPTTTGQLPTEVNPMSTPPPTVQTATQMTSQARKSDNNDEMTGGVIGGVVGAVGGVFLVAIIVVIIICIRKRWWGKIRRKCHREPSKKPCDKKAKQENGKED